MRLLFCLQFPIGKGRLFVLLLNVFISFQQKKQVVNHTFSRNIMT